MGWAHFIRRRVNGMAQLTEYFRIYISLRILRRLTFITRPVFTYHNYRMENQIRHLILLQVQFDEGKREAVLLATVSLRERNY